MNRTKGERGSLPPNSTDHSTTTIAHTTTAAAATAGPPSTLPGRCRWRLRRGAG